MTVAAWLDDRAAVPPPRLTARIRESLALGVDAPRGELPERCIDAAERLLRDLLERESSGRDSALDLLTVDALVTYAFEAASDDPATLLATAADAMRRLAAAAGE